MLKEIETAPHIMRCFLKEGGTYMKKSFRTLLSLFLAVFMVASLMYIPASAASVSLNKTSVTLTQGYQTTLSVSGASSSSVKWSTGDKSIATVSTKGKVVGKAPGTTYIYAKVGSSTLKCKVKVVAAKITASTSSITFDEVGQSKVVTMTVKGSHSGLTVGSTNKKVASASWIRPVEWDGNNIDIRITANGVGTAKIKVYLKKYPSTCYKYITVNVEGDDMVIMPYTSQVNVNANDSYSLQVYSSDINNLEYSVSDSRVINVTRSKVSGNYATYTVKGISAGMASIKFYDKNDTSNSTTVYVTVTGQVAKYYEMYTQIPTKLLATDEIIKIEVNSYTNYYMLVPANYDSAYTNTLIAKKLNKYSYYTVYSEIPSRIASTDTYEVFTYYGTKYSYGTRYVLLPANYDKVKYDTITAKYNGSFEYYKIYSETPNKTDTWDYVKTWTIIDPSTGRTITRYMLVPYNFDSQKVDNIIAEDQNNNNAYSYYVTYTTRPTVTNASDMRIAWASGSTYKYMVIPKTGYDAVKVNDIIQKDTGVYEYNVMYSTSPTADTTKNEAVDCTYIGGRMVYVLYVNNTNASANLDAAYKGALADGIK